MVDEMQNGSPDFMEKERILVDMALHSNAECIRRVAKGLLAEHLADETRKEIVQAVKSIAHGPGEA